MNAMETTIYTTRNGRAVASSLTLRQAMDIVGNLTSEFAESLVAAAKRGTLSESQEAWLHILANEQLNPAANGVQVGDLSGLKRLLQRAGNKLKFPKIHLMAGSNEIVLGIDRGRVKITDADLNAYNDRFGQWMPIYYGAVENGVWRDTQAAAEIKGTIEVILRSMATDPEGTAREFGRLTGRCCFCNLKLSDDRSVEVGYGKVCAQRYGLEWGSKAKVSA